MIIFAGNLKPTPGNVMPSINNSKNQLIPAQANIVLSSKVASMTTTTTTATTTSTKGRVLSNPDTNE